MEIPYELFYFSAIFFAVIAVVAFVRAYRDKKRFFYIGGGLCLLGVVWSILLVLDQVSLAGLFWVVAMIISIVMLPELIRFGSDQMREVDITSPLRAADFFSNRYSGWLKLAYKRGLGVAVILYSMQFAAIVGTMLLAVNLFYDLPVAEFILPFVFGGAITNAIIFYIQFKRA
ncbi:MAG: hypothetical protein JSV18_02945 [Candidatus Bathyarchaeota archaeon]|nr:MAG: hypothetical protein JSV18_02945 [Candidatus Bathyarchaeota archaeon]